MINQVDMTGVKAYSDFEQLPKGAYVCKILGANVKTNSRGQYVEINVDVAEGEYKDHFRKDWENQDKDSRKWHGLGLLSVPTNDGTEQDGWTKKKFKGFMDAIEDSNPGYKFQWDESTFKGKLIGGLFGIREYKGRDGTVKQGTSLLGWASVDKVREGKVRMPKDRLLKEDHGTGSFAAANTSLGGAVVVEPDDDFPF